ncbi:MAG: glutamate-1-semialdehyde 2,1-aminomutase [Paludibacteraceae bacterium]|nr:glutamate-1-semialdehyde 2,1-aminomutase [Paludibacteraceae bacterium]
MERERSKKAFEEAVQYIAGGVNSPVRALKAVGETPLFIDHAVDNKIYDIDGNAYTDYCLSWGVFLLGHAHPSVNQAVHEAVERGSSYGIPSLPETELAKLVQKCFPSMQRMRFVNSGTEATMSAIRLARGYTNRKYIVKFEGNYHGHADHLLVSAGSGVARLGNASSAGVPREFVSQTLVAPYNDTEAVKKIFEEYGQEIAAVILEPVAANMGVVLPDNNFLPFLREITSAYQSLLIFDEVITGFRLSSGGAQKWFGIEPDLTTLGKIVGGGFPAAVFGGRAEIMDLLAPNGPVYQAGTLSGNPVAMSAGIATLTQLMRKGFYEELNGRVDAFDKELREVAKVKNMVLNRVGPMFTLFFTQGEVRNFSDVNRTDQQRFAAFFRYMLRHGVYVSPSQFESNFISIKHTKEELDRFVELVRDFND